MEIQNKAITYHPIGLIHSPFHDLTDMPIQPGSDYSAPGTIEVFPGFTAGLQDLDGFSHIILIYHLHMVHQNKLIITPFLDSQSRGIFATRAPVRPNPIGLSVVKLLKVDGNLLSVDHLDILDGTPLLDIKPYIPEFDSATLFRTGWLETASQRAQKTRSDGRFSKDGS